MSLYEENKLIMRKYNIVPQKKYGQNFLIDDLVLDKIILNADIQKGDLVIEIGPGLGNLTKRLCERAGHVVAIEIDKNMVDILTKEYNKLENLTILNQDIMQANLNEIISEFSDLHKVKVVANLPYYITTPIIIKLIEEKVPVQKIVVMVQKEVGNRFKAKPHTKEYSSLTVYLNYYFNINKIIDVSRNVFIPKPNVDSIVVEFTQKEKKLPLENEDIFFKLVKDSFTQKRKTLKNNLKGYDLEKVEGVLKKHNYDLSVRAEALSLEIFAEISNALAKK